MALIKCPECKKEISDRAQSCIHCGCPIEKELICNECGKKINKDDRVCKNCGCPIELRKEEKNSNINISTKIWFIICIILCFLISGINFFNILNIETSLIVIGGFYINIMGILAFMLGVSYIILLKSFSKMAFHLLLGINAVILVYNVLSFQMIIHLLYIICVILNVLITFFVVRKKLKNSKFSIKGYLPIFIIIFAIGLICFSSVYNDYKNNYDDYENNGVIRNSTVPQIEIITDYINIRDGKSINSKILGKVYYGEIYNIISEDEKSSYNWYEIETSSGIKGYIAGRNNAVNYVRELEITNIDTNEEEPKKEETPNKPNQSTNTNTNNNSNNPNNSNSKSCNESAKQQLTSEYQNTLQQRETEYQTNMANAQQKVDFVKESLDLTGGYLSSEEYNTLYNQATSNTQKELLKNRYNMSITYDKMVNTLNAIPTEYNNWKNTYHAWYQEELKKLDC